MTTEEWNDIPQHTPKPFFTRYLPIEGEIEKGDIVALNIPEGKNPFSLTIGIYNSPTPNVIAGPNHVTIFPTYKTGERIDQGGLAVNKEWVKGKVKLFLCSRDIQVGDKIQAFAGLNGSQAWSSKVYARINEKWVEVVIADREFIVKDFSKINGEGFVTEEDIIVAKSGAYKVIGEISQDALSYVREGMELGEDEIALGAGRNDYLLSDIRKGVWDIAEKRWGEWPIRIKGPCSHFH